MQADLTRPIIGIENRTAQEVFDIMCDRIFPAEAKLAGGEAVKVKPLQDHVEQLAAFLCSEFDFDLNPCVGYSWPEHENDDGYRDGGYVKLQPSDVQAHARNNAKRILSFISALTHPVPTHNDGSGEAVAWQRRLLPGPRVTNTDWHTVTKEQADYAIEHGHPYGIPGVQCEVRPLYTRPDHTSGEVTGANKWKQALEQIDALDEAMGHDLKESHAFEAVAIARAALRGEAS